MNLTEEIAALPLPLRKELEEFFSFLKFKAKQQNAVSVIENEEDNKTWEFGMGKDKIKIADDFDKPLSDFNEYM